MFSLNIYTLLQFKVGANVIYEKLWREVASATKDGARGVGQGDMKGINAAIDALQQLHDRLPKQLQGEYNILVSLSAALEQPSNSLPRSATVSSPPQSMPPAKAGRRPAEAIARITMPIPKQFNFANEDDFIQRFLISLIQRLGFSMTVNYHGSREFGRDLIFAEFDRFGHIRYHALQAKYVPSISVNEIEGLITDANLSFINPFTHPQTGTVERISSFYGVNGGSIAEGASATYFAALAPSRGANVRLLEGKDLIALDRWASMNREQSIASVLSAMVYEIRSNHNTVSAITAWMEQFVNAKDGGSYPIRRLRTVAVAKYLEAPPIPLQVPTENVSDYFDNCCMWNYVADSIGASVTGGNFKERRLEGLKQLCQQVITFGPRLDAMLRSAMTALGPTTPL